MFKDVVKFCLKSFGNLFGVSVVAYCGWSRITYGGTVRLGPVRLRSRSNSLSPEAWP